MNGASARTRPTKRPIRIVSPPWRSKKPLDLLEARLGDLHPRAVAHEEVAAEPAAEVVARDVAGDRAEPHDRRSARARDLALAGDHAADEDRPSRPGATRPTNAPVSRNAMHADEQVGPLARAPRRRPRSASSRFGQRDDAAAVDARAPTIASSRRPRRPRECERRRRAPDASPTRRRAAAALHRASGSRAARTAAADRARRGVRRRCARPARAAARARPRPSAPAKRPKTVGPEPLTMRVRPRRPRGRRERGARSTGRASARPARGR